MPDGQLGRFVSKISHVDPVSRISHYITHVRGKTLTKHDAPGTAALRRWLPVLILLIFIVSGRPWVVAARQKGSPPPVPAALGALEDVEAAFGRIHVSGEHLTARSNGLIPRPRYRTTFANSFGLRNHFQGIQRLPHSSYLVISGSNRQTSELFVVRLGGEGREDGEGSEGSEVVARIGLDPVLWHAGGLSMLGTTLAVPLHGGSPRQAKVVFYDLTHPEAPRKLPVEIDRPGRKAGAIAMTRLTNGRLLAAVLSAFDGLPRRMDLYLSRSENLEDGFLPEPVTWRVSQVQARAGHKKTFSYFQAINFVRQADGRLYMVGFHNDFFAPSILPGRDYADLYEVVFPGNTIEAPTPALAEPAIIKIANRMLRCTEGFCNLDAAAGLFVDPVNQALSIYATPGWLDGDTVKVTVYRSAGSRPYSAPLPLN